MPLFPFSLQGALARESLPAAGSAYATDIQRAELRLLFRRHGCHHCGKRFGPVIADHQPPNKTVYGALIRHNTQLDIDSAFTDPCNAGSTAAAVAAAAAQKVADDNPFVVRALCCLLRRIRHSLRHHRLRASVSRTPRCSAACLRRPR